MFSNDGTGIFMIDKQSRFMNKENVKDGGMSYPNILKLGSVSYVGEI